MNLRKSSPAAFLRRNGLAILLTAGVFALMYAAVIRYRTVDGSFVTGQGAYISDYISHILWAIAMSAEDIATSFFNGSERLWHIFVKLLFPGVVHNMWIAAALVTAAADATAFFLLYKAIETALPEDQPRWLPALAVFSVFVVNALALPGGSLYTAHGAVNTWHNPTNIMVRPFAAAAFFMTVRIYNRRRWDYHSALVLSPDAASGFSFADSVKGELARPVYTRFELVAYPLCLLLSAYAKPSFLQFFAPAILIFLAIDVIRTRGKLLPFCIKLALAYIPAGLVVCSQLFSFFGDTGLQTAAAVAETASTASAGVAIYFIQASFASLGELLTVFGNKLFSSVICLCAFPLFVLLVDGRRAWGDTAFRLGLFGMVIGWLESLLLHETGSRASHGNFLWGFYLSAWMFWAAAMGRYTQLVRERSRRGSLMRWVGSALLAWHFTTGVVYLVHILQTGQYLC